MSNSRAQSVLDELCEQVGEHYNRKRFILRGREAETVRNCYYRYWLASGKPNSRLHKRIARSVFASRNIHLRILLPALARLSGHNSHAAQ
ncbi:hypothetical protein R20233_02302 [Ralstonia sp. LMG 32965]|uniref:hypothetical protein n=1 Tax=Ralstonia TaxID=48736 RepID=UPI0012DEB43D|nr:MULTISPECIES: hypothetical protein [unclassified Ralstonia]CAJ0877193.1 hypothetical protein R20233_02302 [Ralstonia sp. LMG 32965]